MVKINNKRESEKRFCDIEIGEFFLDFGGSLYVKTDDFIAFSFENNAHYEYKYDDHYKTVSSVDVEINII